MSFFGVGASFWGLLVGGVLLVSETWRSETERLDRSQATCGATRGFSTVRAFVMARLAVVEWTRARDHVRRQAQYRRDEDADAGRSAVSLDLMRFVEDDARVRSDSAATPEDSAELIMHV